MERPAGAAQAGLFFNITALDLYAPAAEDAIVREARDPDEPRAPVFVVVVHDLRNRGLGLRFEIRHDFPLSTLAFEQAAGDGDIVALLPLPPNPGIPVEFGRRLRKVAPFGLLALWGFESWSQFDIWPTF
jgi:hypothetical protein